MTFTHLCVYSINISFDHSFSSGYGTIGKKSGGGGGGGGGGGMGNMMDEMQKTLARRRAKVPFFLLFVVLNSGSWIQGSFSVDPSLKKNKLS